MHNSLFGSICFGLFSILEGAGLKERNIIYCIIGLIFFLISIYFYWRKIKFFRNTKKSGEVQSFRYDVSVNKENKLVIIQSIYGTSPDHFIDVTDTLNDKIGNLVIKKKYNENESVNIP